jgi:hypothetical protein
VSTNCYQNYFYPSRLKCWRSLSFKQDRYGSCVLITLLSYIPHFTKKNRPTVWSCLFGRPVVTFEPIAGCSWNFVLGPTSRHYRLAHFCVIYLLASVTPTCSRVDLLRGSNTSATDILYSVKQHGYRMKSMLTLGSMAVTNEPLELDIWNFEDRFGSKHRKNLKLTKFVPVEISRPNK